MIPFVQVQVYMPQKKNPDVPELLRGKTGRVYGNLISLLTVLKGLPLAYNKDLQEDKEGMFDTVETLTGSLKLLAPMIETMTVNKEKMYQAVSQDYSNATDLADYLRTKVYHSARLMRLSDKLFFMQSKKISIY